MVLEYDEDLNQNPFFTTFLHNYLDLFSRCVLERWIICVPRKDSLPISTPSSSSSANQSHSHAVFTIEDFTHHILKPLNQLQELQEWNSNNDNNNDETESNYDANANNNDELLSTSTGPSSGTTAPKTSSSIVDGNRRMSTCTTSSSSSGTNDSSSPSSKRGRRHGTGPQRKWNFISLAGSKIEYDYNTLYVDQTQQQTDSSDVTIRRKCHQHPKLIRVLFEETFYTSDKQKYKVLCIASPLNSKVEDPTTTEPDELDELGQQQQQHDTPFNPSSLHKRNAKNSIDWTLSSLRDCIDFIWLNGKLNSLEIYDGLIKLFLHNHNQKGLLDDLPINVQQNLVLDVYQKCLKAGYKVKTFKKKRTKKYRTQIENLQINAANSAAGKGSSLQSSTEEIPTSTSTSGRRSSLLPLGDFTDNNLAAISKSQAAEPPPDPISESELDDSELDSEQQLQSQKLYSNFSLATETYVLHGLYRHLIHSISSALSAEDSHLNKILRNLIDITPKDFRIKPEYWDRLGLAKIELNKIGSLSSPLTKLDCLKKTMNHLLHDNKPMMMGETHLEEYDLGDKDGGEQELSSTPTEVLSTDELIPMWVYLIIKTPIGNWYAQLEFLKRFRLSSQAEGSGSEANYLITTLEAAIIHLSSEHAASCLALGGEVDDNGEDEGLTSSSVTDTELLHNNWIPNYFTNNDGNNEEDDYIDPEILQMFQLIRKGNLIQLEKLINTYEMNRKAQLRQLLNINVDESKLCHPLCHCDTCTKLLNPEQEQIEELQKSIYEYQLSSNGLSLLHMAAICGRPKIVEYLLGGSAVNGDDDRDHGSSNNITSIRDHLLMTPLHYAAARGHQNALLLLCHSGANLTDLDHMYNTPLHYATLNGHDSCVKALIYYAEHTKNPMNISLQNYNGDTPLHFACKNGYQNIVQILVENGASIIINNARQLSPIDCSHNIHIARILQRSLTRRTLYNVSNHDDFINVEMMRKEESSSSAGVIMLISEPPNHKEDNVAEQEEESLTNPKITISQSNVNEDVSASTTNELVPSGPPGRRVRKISYNMTSSVSLDKTGAGNTNMNRRSSLQFQPMSINNNIQAQGFRRSRLFKPSSSNSFEFIEAENELKEKQRLEALLVQDNEAEANAKFNVLNPAPPKTFEPEHFKGISVDKLEGSDGQEEFISKNQLAAIATAKRKRKEIGIRKLFTAIAVGDLPLSLFYLGIPTDELENLENILPGQSIINAPPCHPLCSCSKCVAVSTGLGLDVNIKNAEGLSCLHLAVMYNEHDLVKILLKYGANIKLKTTFENKSALDLAYELHFDEIVTTLKEWEEAEQQQSLSSSTTSVLTTAAANSS